ncbi:MAG: ferrous iron transport protein B [Clostridium sp.]|uniref:ferrous iron transport protein B n=1 Tax=Clostridium sp. TaxID=1506 RepID=UPI003F2A9571
MRKIALVGNPNSGKTSIFNSLTGAKQHVGNWPGVTVEKKEGRLNYKEKEFKIVDLPGTYSLGTYSEDEIIGRDYILSKDADLVVNILDSTNIERNLYFTLQLLELDIDVLVCLNMLDLAAKDEVEINKEKLSKILGVEVVGTVGLNEKGISELLEGISKKSNKKGKIKIDYDSVIEKEIENISKQINKPIISKRWSAIKLLENDSNMKEKLGIEENKELKEVLNVATKNIEKHFGYEAEMEIVNQRYKIVNKIVEETIVKKNVEKITLTDKIDKILTHKIWGLPIFAAVMLCLYQATFVVGATMQEWVDGFIGSVGEQVVGYLEGIGTSNLLVSIVGDGIFGGTGAVLSFLPLIITMYFLIGLLEDSGYMARAAYVMDRIMRKVGLHGKTFVSMIVSFGCNVPGIMATRTLDNKKDRMIAILINPFISCGARLPIYALFISAFFESHRGLILFSMYALGIIVALIVGKIFSKTLFKGEESYFIMELPSYKMPSIRNISLLMWDKAGAFLKKAGGIILPMMVILAFLSNFPIGVDGNSSDSLLGIIGGTIAPIFTLAGFGTWQAVIALITGILAKETVIGTMGLTYAGVEEGIAVVAAIQSAFSPLSAISFMIMSLLYTPCLVALGAIKRETNSWKWTLFTAGYTFGVAWVISVLVFQVGSLLGF